MPTVFPEFPARLRVSVTLASVLRVAVSRRRDGSPGLTPAPGRASDPMSPDRSMVLAGCGGGGSGWPGVGCLARFRASPAVLNVTLGLPRVLLRAPYGRAGEQVAAFPFDEGLT